MSAGRSVYTKDDLTVGGALAGADHSDPAPENFVPQDWNAIGPKRGETASLRAGEDNAVQGGIT